MTNNNDERNDDYRGIFAGYFQDIREAVKDTTGQDAAHKGDWDGVQKATEEITRALGAITDYLGHGTAEADALQAVFIKAINEIRDEETAA